MDNRFKVAVGAGKLMSASGAAGFPHRWTRTASRWKVTSPAGICSISRQRDASSVMCIGKPRRWVGLKGVRVAAAGGFDTTTWQSTGIGYSVEVSSDAPADEPAHLFDVVDDVAEILVLSGPEPAFGGFPEAPLQCH